MLTTFKRHWPHYLAEAAGLGFFMSCASAFTTALRSPFSPLASIIKDPFQQLVVLGVLMGFVIAAIVYSPWGKKSGAHINPAVTLAFLRLGKITLADAFFYIAFQFLGGVLVVQMMGLVLGAAYRHKSINHVVTAAGVGGQGKAFIAEFVITFILMLALLLAANSKKTEKLAGVFAGVLIALYLMFEEPYSGMSLNPARSFASAFAARDWKDLWIFFIAPPLAALLATQVFLWRFKNSERLSQHPMEEEKESASTVEIDRTPEPPIIRTYGATP